MKLTPALSNEIDDLLDKATHEKFLNGESLRRCSISLLKLKRLRPSSRNLKKPKKDTTDGKLSLKPTKIPLKIWRSLENR